MPNCFVATNFIEFMQKKIILENSSLCPPSTPAYLPWLFCTKILLNAKTYFVSTKNYESSPVCSTL